MNGSCPNCGVQISNTATNCSQCGQILNSEKTSRFPILLTTISLSILSVGSCTFMPWLESSYLFSATFIFGCPVLFILVLMLNPALRDRRSNDQSSNVLARSVSIEPESKIVSNYPRLQGKKSPTLSNQKKRIIYGICFLASIAVLPIIPLFRLTIQSQNGIALLSICTCLLCLYGFFWRANE